MLTFLGRKLVGRHDLSRQMARYRDTVAWLYRALLRFSWIQTVFAVGASIAGVSMQGATLAFLMYVANLMESGGKITIEALDIVLVPRSDLTFLVLVITAGTALLLAAGVTFLGNMKTIDLSVRFAVHCSQRSVALENARPPGDAPPETATYPRSMVGRTTGIVGIARGVRPVLKVISPSILFVYSTLALFYIDTLLTIGVSALIFPSILAQYKINYLAAQNQKRLGGARDRAQKSILTWLNALALSPRLHASERARLREAYNDDRIAELSQRYHFRIAAQPYSQLVSDVIIALVVIGVTARLGTAALSGAVSWSTFIGYLVFARISLVSLRAVFSAITGFARHYPLVRKTYEVLSNPPKETAASLRNVNIPRRGRGRIGDLRAAQMRRGRPIAVIAQFPISRFNVYAYVDGLSGRRAKYNRNLRNSAACCPDALNAMPGGSVVELLDLPEDATPQDALNRLQESNPSACLPIEDICAPLDEQTWQHIPRDVRAQVLLNHAATVPSDLLLVEAEVLKAAPQPVRDAWWPRVDGRFVAVRYADPSTAAAFGEALVVALGTDRENIVMSPDWAHENAAEVQAWLAAHTAEAASEKEEEDFDE